MSAMVTKPDMQSLVAQTANRLRFLQVDLTDEPAAAREDYLASEMRQAMEGLTLQSRQVFLDELGARFPVWNDVPPATVASPPSATEPRPMDAPALAEQLIRRGSDLPMAQREQMLKKIQQSWGLAVTAPVVLQPRVDTASTSPKSAFFVPNESVLQELGRRVGLPANQLPDAAQVGPLATYLTDFVLTLQPLVARVWRSMQPSSASERTLQQGLQAYLQGKNGSFPAELLQLRQLIAALVNVLPHLGSRLYELHLARFQPGEIEDAVKAENAFMLMGRDNKNWVKYKQLAPLLEEAAIISAVKQAIGEMVETCVQIPPGSVSAAKESRP